MKKLAMITAAVALSACAQNNSDMKHMDEPMVGMANPASVFCEKQGGKSVVRKDKDGGEYGVCVFANGKEVDEWDYYRTHHRK